ncbi:MAG: hypothetical protein V1696_03475, partial [Candidatus Jorgensenbacteria bacterium]
MARSVRILLIFALVTGWIFSGFPRIWQNPPFPPEIQKAWAATFTETFSTAGDFTWTAPVGVTTSSVEVWGAGGGGADTATNTGGGGGGGGAYAKATVNVIAGTGYAVTVGAGGAVNSTVGGGTSTFAGTYVYAQGGRGTNAVVTAGLGGSTANSSGTVVFAGGDGNAGDGTNDTGGGGGGAGGPDGVGLVGARTDLTIGGFGGAGDNGLGGGGGIGGNAKAGANGTSSIVGGGGGGGGDDNFFGGNGGAPGGGGGGGNTGVAGTIQGAAGQVKITYTIWTVLDNGANPSSATIGPGGAATEVDAFTFQTSTSTDTITAATVTLAANTTSSIAEVAITSDNGATVYGSSTNPTANSFSITLNQNTLTANATQTQYKIRITPKSHANMPAPSLGQEYAVTARITAWAGTNSQTGTDTGSATITVDNLSPANVSGASGTAGDTQVSLSWTNPGDADFTTTTILRAITAIGNTAPTEGTNYATSTTINTTTTVACVVGGGAGNPVSCISTGLINNTAYHYKIFAQDSRGNYATGTVPTNSPFTPFAATVSCSTNPSSTSFGPLSTSTISTASPNASTTMTCTYTLGCTLSIQDLGNGSSPGLATSSPAYLIPSNTATLSAGTEGYGIQAAATAS